MTRILRNDSYDPANKETEIAFDGDTDLGDYELRRIFPITEAKVARVADALYPEGFITDGLAASVPTVTNQLWPSNDFTGWTSVGGASLAPGVAPDRYGRIGYASRLSAPAGQDGYIQKSVGSPTGRKVFSVDVQADVAGTMRLSIWDGIAEVGTTDANAVVGFNRFFVAVDDAWNNGASECTVRIRPGINSAGGSIFISEAQVEDIPDGAPMTPSAYVETTTGPASGPSATVVLTDGSAKVAGMPRPVAGASLTFDPAKITGVDLIYLEFAERYILSNVDSSLENPKTGRPGNDSVREETKLVTTDTSNPTIPLDPTLTNPQYRSRVAVAIYQFDRATGIVSPVVSAANIDVSKTTGTLVGSRIQKQSIPEDALDLQATENQPGLLAANARRTRNLAGAFVVPHTGDVPSITQDLTVVDKVQAKIDPLDGYTPDGSSHYLDEPVIVTMPLQATTGRRQHESHVYYAGTDTYPVSRKPLVSMNALTGYMRVTQNVTRGPVAGGMDELANTPVFLLIAVTQGATTYTVGPGGDCVQNGDSIDWSPSSGSEPATGSTYQAIYLFTRTWPANEFTIDADGITFTGGNRPEPTYPFELDYQYGQDRVDLVLLGADGIQVLAGNPSDHPAPPPVPRGAMALWDATVPYGALAATFSPRFTVGVPMAKIADMQSKLDTLFYNVAQLAASISLRDRLGTLKDTITDPFLDDRQLDAGASFYTSSGNKVARIDGGRLKMSRSSDERALTVNAPGTNWQTTDVWAGLPYTQATGPANDQFSTNVSINPFGNYELIPPLLSLSSQATGGWPGSFLGKVTVSGIRFQPNEVGIQVKADGVLVGTVNADANGRISLTFTRQISTNTIVSATGAGGTATAVVGANSITWPRRDPAAQTFVLDTAGDILGVSLYFSNKDNSQSVVISLRRTIAGLPSDQVVPGTIKELTPAQVNTGGAPTTVLFDRPIPADTASGYAIVAASNSGNYRLELAQLGKQNLGPAGGYITKNPYAEGVMLASSDGRVWTPYQDQDLRFSVIMAAYDTSGAKTLLADVEHYAGGINSFQLKAMQSVAPGATITWQYCANPLDTVPTWIPFDPGPFDTPNEIDMGLVTTDLQLRAIATTTDKNAGVQLNVQNLKLIGYQVDTLSSYVQVQTALLASTTSVRAYTQVALPSSNTSVTPYASVDDGATWVAGTLESSRALTEELTEQEWSFTFGTPGTAFRGRADMVGTTTESPEVEQASFVIQ